MFLVRMHVILDLKQHVIFKPFKTFITTGLPTNSKFHIPQKYPSLASNDFGAVKSLHYPNNMSIKGGILYRLQRFVRGGHSFVKAVLWTSS